MKRQECVQAKVVRVGKLHMIGWLLFGTAQHDDVSPFLNLDLIAFSQDCEGGRAKT